MCLGCNCPEPIPAPNQTLAKCRKYLQGLAFGLVVIGAIGLACSQIIQLLLVFMLVYMLYISWTTFNWCIVLAFFMLSTMQTVQSAILFVGILQYNQFLTKGYIVISIYCLLLIIYYPLAVFVSHYCYKHFKHNFSNHNQLLLPGPGANNAGPQQIPGGFGGRYHRMVDDRVDDHEINLRTAQNTNHNNQFFRGQGVRIG